MALSHFKIHVLSKEYVGRDVGGWGEGSGGRQSGAAAEPLRVQLKPTR